MGTLFFLVIHAGVVLFVSPWLLVITVPLHLILGAVLGGGASRPSRWTHVRCPDCAELVLNEARVCKHCGCALVPQAATGWLPWH